MVPIKQMVHRNWLYILTVAWLLFLTVRVGAEVPEAEEVFQKLLQSFQTVDFEGKLTFILLIPDGSPMCEARVIRKAPDKQRIEFVRPPEMRGTGMVINGKERWRIQNERSRRRRPFSAPPPDRFMEDFPLKNIRLLQQNYQIRVLDGGHVAGRKTHLLEIDPKATGRPSRKTWVDTETGVILKMEHYNSQKRLEQLLAYSEINFKPEMDEATFRRPDKMGPGRGPREAQDRAELWNYDQPKLDLDRIRKEVELNVIIPDQAPDGFILQSIHALKVGERKNVYLRYTDGLAMLSVFQSPSDEGGRGGRRRGRREDKPPWRGSNVEKMNIDGIECEVISAGPMLIFRWNYKEIHLTLMGELEKKEMTKIVSLFVSEGRSEEK